MTLRQSNDPPNGKLKSTLESMLIISFDIKGILHKELILAGQTASSSYYCAVLRRLLGKFAKTSTRTLVTKELAVAS
jgi:hypothetical protein